MSSMRHLKDALKGTQKRLERAEALLRQGLFVCEEARNYDCDYGAISNWEEKVEKHLHTPIDTSE